MSEERLPPGWVWTTFRDCAEVITGTTPSKVDASNYDNYLPFVKPPELNDREIFSAADNLSEKGAALARVLAPNSVLVSCIGNLGKTGINKVPVAVNQQINALIFPNGIEPKYGFYYCQTSMLRDYLQGVASATTVTIVNKSKFQLATFPLAPLAEQHRIVAEIEKQLPRLDAGVAALQRARARLRLYKAAVLKAACEGRLVPQDPVDEPASVLLQRILAERRARWEAEQTAKGKDPQKLKYKEPAPPDASGLPELPEGWVWASVEQVAAHEPNSITDGPFGSKLKTSHYTPTGPRVIRLQNIGDGVFDDEKAHISQEHYRTLSKHRIYAGDLVIAALGVGLPRACIIPQSVGPAIVKADCIRFKPNQMLADNRYLNAALNSNVIKEIARNTVHGIGRPRLNQQEIKSVPIPLPPLAEQQRIVAEVERRLSVVQELEAAAEANLKHAERLRQAVLKRAFEGRLAPQDPDDEPAEILLERIRAERERGKVDGRQKPGLPATQLGLPNL
jgi:type I restriction enzyme S subunit